MTHKAFADNQQAASKLWQDVGRNNVKIYDVQDYRSKCTVSEQPTALTDKCTHVTVAVSGDDSTGRDWMVIVPYRVDIDKATKEKCLDIDPTLLVLDSDTGSQHPSGVVAFHQPFSGRTTEIPGYCQATIQSTILDLRTKLTTGTVPLDQASAEVKEAMNHMVYLFSPFFDATQP